MYVYKYIFNYTHQKPLLFCDFHAHGIGRPLLREEPCNKGALMLIQCRNRAQCYRTSVCVRSCVCVCLCIHACIH